MELSVARKTVDKHLEKMLDELCLDGWSIEMNYGQIDRGTLGECRVACKYKEAWIILNHEKIHNQAHLIEILKHELLHLVLAKLEAMRDMLCEVLPSDQFKMVDSLLSNTTERIITHLERVLERKGKKNGRR